MYLALNRCGPAPTTRRTRTIAETSSTLRRETETAPGSQDFFGIVGQHPTMQRVFDLIRRVGPADVPVLITGESGTGKELVARAIHHVSGRSAKALVPVHCGAIPEELLESELFGHVKGAFTGALGNRPGRFQLADGGTVFLDEVGEMSARFQTKLLRVLEDGTFDPVGGTAVRRTDARVVAATHRDLHEMVRGGGFREDLLYRLDVVAIRLPSLREHRSDIPMLVRHFLDGLSQKRRFPTTEVTEDAMRALVAWDWPGNVRELRNVLERAALLADRPGQIHLCDLPEVIAAGAAVAAESGSTSRESEAAPQPWDFGPAGANFYNELEIFERRMISRALRLAGGSKREAARLLSVNRTTLLEKLKRRGWSLEDLAPELASRARPDWSDLAAEELEESSRLAMAC